MYDAVLFYSEMTGDRVELAQQIFDSELISHPYVLVTLHRAENTASMDKLNSILDALRLISNELPIIWPVHPRTSGKIRQFGLSIPQEGKRIFPIDPVGYLSMLKLLKNCQLVLTDSGGLQKEAYFFGKPCITMREETEWMELIECKHNALVGAQTDKIVKAFRTMVNRHHDFRPGLYGDGNASQKILAVLAKHFAEKSLA